MLGPLGAVLVSPSPTTGLGGIDRANASDPLGALKILIFSGVLPSNLRGSADPVELKMT